MKTSIMNFINIRFRIIFIFQKSILFSYRCPNYKVTPPFCDLELPLYLEVVVVVLSQFVCFQIYAKLINLVRGLGNSMFLTNLRHLITSIVSSSVTPSGEAPQHP